MGDRFHKPAADLNARYQIQEECGMQRDGYE